MIALPSSSRCVRSTLALLTLALAACSSISGDTSPTEDAGSKKDTGSSTKDSGGGKKDSGGATKDSGSTKKDAGKGDSGSHPGIDAGACAPTATCKVADKTCLGVVDNSGKTAFGLRMSQITFTAPSVLSSGTVGTILGGDVTPDNLTCNQTGSGTFSWLLKLDTTAGTLETGGATPPADPTQGYAFANATVGDGGSSLTVAPATFTATPSSTGAFATTTGQNLVMPVYLDATGTNFFVLPLQQLSLKGTLSSDQDCIGTYNAGTLDPVNSCQPADGTLAFTQGGTGSAFISLDDADNVVITELQETLCVLLSGDGTTYGNGASPVNACKRDSSNNVVFQGSWCASTNAAATATCADSVELTFGYAASSVLITN